MNHGEDGHVIPEHLRPEEAAFSPFDDLLIDGLRRVVHDHRALENVRSTP